MCEANKSEAAGRDGGLQAKRAGVFSGSGSYKYALITVMSVQMVNTQLGFCCAETKILLFAKFIKQDIILKIWISQKRKQ